MPDIRYFGYSVRSITNSRFHLHIKIDAVPNTFGTASGRSISR